MSLTPRMKDALDILAIALMKSENLPIAELNMQGTFIDVSQSLSRRAWTQKNMNKCFCTSTCLYHYGQDRAVLPIETLFAQGYPRTLKVPGQGTISHSDLKEFAGEGMALPCLAALIWSIYTCVDFTGKSVAELANPSQDEYTE